MERAFTAGLEQASISEPFQVMAQGGGRQVDVALDVARRSSAVPSLHDETKDRQPNGMAERAQLFGVSVQFGGHGYF